MNFVTAAAGRRDDYQVPIALCEANLLAYHVTDFYVPDPYVPLLRRFGAKGQRVLKRHHPHLPSRLVHANRRLTMQQAAAALIPKLRDHFNDDQDPISWSALRLAQRFDADLLLYAGYAYKAFTSESAGERKKALIQYHPHIRDSAAILRADAERFSFIQSALEQLSLDEQDTTNLPELETADLVICNSTFTASTCKVLGIPKEKIRVIPYGIDSVSVPHTPRRNDSLCTFLFVGSGIQRKGLHHLFLAWKQAQLKHSKLIIVSRSIDPEISSIIDSDDNIICLDSVDNEELNKLYLNSDVFVLPSLIEGFGYVYLEAMARGCFCIGTANTGLPDVATSQSADVLSAGDLNQLKEALCRAEHNYHQGNFNRDEIAKAGSSRQWKHFRADIREAMHDLLTHK